MQQALFTLTQPVGTTVNTNIRVNNTSRQPTQIKASANPVMGARGGIPSKYVPPQINGSVRANVSSAKMSASSSSGISNSLGARAQYSQFSQAAAISGNDYNIGGGVSMNADTTKWGKMGKASFAKNDVLNTVSNISNQAKGMKSTRAQARAQCGDYSFNIAGASMSVKGNFQDATFGGVRKA